MTDGNNRLTVLISKITKFRKLSAVDSIDYISQVESDPDYRSEILIDPIDIRNIIINYRSYPLYLIKYVFALYPYASSAEAIDCVIKATIRRYDLIECILTSYSIKLCEIPDISLDCRIIDVYKKVKKSHTVPFDDLETSFDLMEKTDLVHELIMIINAIDNKKSKDTCNCADRTHWYVLYDRFMEALEKEKDILYESNNFCNALINLVSQTDVADFRLSNILLRSVKIPERWRALLIMIKRTGFVSRPYGDIIFSIRDAILNNDRKLAQDRNVRIENFCDRLLLKMLLERYNEYHSNISMVTDQMYVTDIHCARNTNLLQDLGVDTVISLTKRSIFRASNVRYHQIRIDDLDSVDFISETLEVADKVIELINKNKIILVHCYKGISRSVSFVILVLVKQGMKYQEAFDLVKSKRVVANPNPTFRKQLMTYAKRLEISRPRRKLTKKIL